MKARIKKTTMMLASLLMVIGLGGCKNEDYPIKTLIPDDVVSQRYYSFFAREVKNFFSEDSNNDVVHIINSQDELKKIYQGSSQIPQVSLNGHTLLIAKVVTGNLSCVIENQVLTLQDDIATMKMDLNPTAIGGWPDRSNAVYFWGLYPKNYIRKVNVNKDISDYSDLKEPKEVEWNGTMVSVKRADQSSLPKWFVGKIETMGAVYALEGKWKNETVYIIMSWQGMNSNFYAQSYTLFATIFDDSGNIIRDEVSGVTDVKCIYYNISRGGSYN